MNYLKLFFKLIDSLVLFRCIYVKYSIKFLVYNCYFFTLYVFMFKIA